MTHQDFEKLNQIIQENKIILFSDEVYRESEYLKDDRLPAACDVNEKSVSLGVMSKSYGLAGLRIGWIATRNPEVHTRMSALKDYTTICNSAPSEFLAEFALRHREVLIERNVGIINDNLNVLDQFFQQHKDRFIWQRPKAGPVAFPRLIGENVENFCDLLVKTANVLLLPGTVYDNDRNNFRIGFGRKNLPEAIKRLEDFLSHYKI